MCGHDYQNGGKDEADDLRQILIGVHGNGLTHQLWMAPGGSVVEVSEVPSVSLSYIGS